MSRAIAQASDRPSKVLVPRPISSSRMRLRAVALCRMLAASVISTMKVERPPARSSAAPMRVKIRSSGPNTARSAGTELPTCASSAMSPAGPMQVDFPPLLGPEMEAVQLLGDEGVRGFDRLAPDVVPGYPLGIAAGDLDEESLHAVVADLEGGESGAFAFAPLEFEQEGVGVGRDAPQLIELAIVAARDDIALAHQGGGLGGDGG